MNTPSVKSFRALRKLRLNVNPRTDVEVTRAGSHYRARFNGQANCVFGETAQQAKHRLLSVVAKKRGIVPAPIADLEKQLLEAFR